MVKIAGWTIQVRGGRCGRRKGSEVGDFIGGLKPLYARSIEGISQHISGPNRIEVLIHSFIPCFVFRLFIYSDRHYVQY